MAILEVAQLEKSFGGTKVLRDISFSLEEGQALSIIGSSGSGKTTLLRCLNFLETPDSGRIAVRGRNLLDGSLSPQERRRREYQRQGEQIHHLAQPLQQGQCHRPEHGKNSLHSDFTGRPFHGPP